MNSTDIPHLLDDAIQAIAALRESGAHLHSITNSVAQNFTANVLLACGATVSMTSNADEMPDFLRHADALHINLGTLDNARMRAIDRAVELACSAGLPVILDPVKIDTSGLRRSFALELAGRSSIIKGNAAEIACLQDELDEDVCLVTTGAVDRILFGNIAISVTNGHAYMDKVIATGCALGALAAALSAQAGDRRSASLAALLWFSISGELAAEKARGPGTFQQEFLDALSLVSLEELRERAKVST